MSIKRNERQNGQVTYTARVVVGRGGYAGEKTFPTRREARNWEAEQRRSLEIGGLDSSAGKSQVRLLLDQWLDLRRSRVAPNTIVADGQFIQNVPTWFGRIQAR